MILRAGLRALRTVGPLAGLALLAGCISLGSKAPHLLFGLTAESAAPAGAAASGQYSDALLVLDPVADRRLDVTRIAVQVDETQISYVKDAAWVERPVRLFRRLLAETIRARHQRLVLESSDEDVGTKNVLSGRLIDFGYDARSQSAVVRYDAVREDGKGAVGMQRFEAVERGVPPNAEFVGPALNRAANRVAVQVADWVSQP